MVDAIFLSLFGLSFSLVFLLIILRLRPALAQAVEVAIATPLLLAASFFLTLVRMGFIDPDFSFHMSSGLFIFIVPLVSLFYSVLGIIILLIGIFGRLWRRIAAGPAFVPLLVIALVSVVVSAQQEIRIVRMQNEAMAAAKKAVEVEQERLQKEQRERSMGNSEPGKSRAEWISGKLAPADDAVPLPGYQRQGNANFGSDRYSITYSFSGDKETEHTPSSVVISGQRSGNCSFYLTHLDQFKDKQTFVYDGINGAVLNYHANDPTLPAGFSSLDLYFQDSSGCYTIRVRAPAGRVNYDSVIGIFRSLVRMP